MVKQEQPKQELAQCPRTFPDEHLSLFTEGSLVQLCISYFLYMYMSVSVDTGCFLIHFSS